jgi:hypothetical protein
MKKLVLSIFFVAISFTIFAQPKIDLGLKGGVNFSDLSLNIDDYTSESIVKSHIGAFARVGFGRIFIQPEVYFSGKGGDVTSNIFNTLAGFDYNSVDVPILLGFSIIKGENFDLHAIAGPVFSGLATKNITGTSTFNKEYYEDNYFSVQYGLGIDVFFLTLDARLEDGLNYLYNQSGIQATNKTFMISVGFKIF